MPELTMYQRHVRDWKDCTRCPAHQHRKRTALVRGSLPCDVLFVGEAPGESEDVLGVPFVGPAGQLLDHVVRRSLPTGTTWAMTNVVACIPRDDGKGKLMEPDDDQVRACSPRVAAVARMASPRLVVCVGKVAEAWLTPGLRDSLDVDPKVPRVTVTHPAAILRANVAQQSLLIQKCIIIIRTALEDMT